jgi:hypothetical protein
MLETDIANSPVRVPPSYHSADLQGIDLRGTALSEAVLERAILLGANIAGPDLRCANLRYADLRWANLRYADLRGADLTGADVTGADLACTDLRGATLPEEYIATCREDTLRILPQFKDQAAYIRHALVEGRIDGTRTNGQFAALLGRVANAEQEGVGAMCRNQGYDADSDSPARNWFFQIRLGDTPDNNSFARLALEWCATQQP